MKIPLVLVCVFGLCLLVIMLAEWSATGTDGIERTHPVQLSAMEGMTRRTKQARVPTATVPEPSTLSLMVLGLACGAAYVGRRGRGHEEKRKQEGGRE